nr:retrovirus-related Pol polyprotein from transposon TNT 1-94 [Tanacetum cinerariifolium]
MSSQEILTFDGYATGCGMECSGRSDLPLNVEMNCLLLPKADHLYGCFTTVSDERKMNSQVHILILTASTQKESTTPPGEGLVRPKMNVQTICVDENMAVLSVSVTSIMDDNVVRIPHASRIIVGSDAGDGTTVPVRRIFDRFRNMHISNCQTDRVICADIPRTKVFTRQMTTRNHAHLCLDTKHRFVRHEIINFPSTDSNVRHSHHSHVEHLQNHTDSKIPALVSQSSSGVDGASLNITCSLVVDSPPLEAPILNATNMARKDEEEVSSDDNEMVEVKVLMALTEENDVVSKDGAKNGEWVKISMKKCISEQIPPQKKRILKADQLTEDPSSSGQKDLVFVKSLADDIKVSIPDIERPWLSEAEGFIMPNHVIADESLVCSTPLPPLKKLDGAEPISGPKTIKSILKSKSTLKVKTLEGVIINESSSAPAKDNKSSSSSKVTLAPAGSYDHDTNGLNRIISLERDINLRNPQHAFKRCKACGSSNHTTTDHYDIGWFKRGEALQAKKAKALKSTKAKSSNANRSMTLTRSGCSRHMTGVKSYLHKYVQQPGPNVVFGNDSTCITEGYGSIKCNGIVFTKVAFVDGLKYNLISTSQLCNAKYIVQFDEKKGIIFNSNKEVVMIAPRVRDVYVLDMTSSAQESCFFAKASKNISWLWHKRLAHLNFKIINKLAKQNFVIGLPSLDYLKDKPCPSYEKGKHHRASFKTKQTSSIKKCLYLLHMDLFGPVALRSINHESTPGNEYYQRDKIQAKPDKIEHKTESVEKPKDNQSQQKVNPDKVKATKSSSQKKYNYKD